MQIVQLKAARARSPPPSHHTRRGSAPSLRSSRCGGTRAAGTCPRRPSSAAGKSRSRIRSRPARCSEIVSTVKIDGSGWSKLTVPIVLKREVVAPRHVIAVPRDDIERRMVERRRPQPTEIFWMTSVGSSRSSKAATGISKSRGLARPLAPIGPRSGRRNGSAVILRDIATRFAVDPTRNFRPRGTSATRPGPAVDPPSSVCARCALLRDDQQLAVRVDEHAPSMLAARDRDAPHAFEIAPARDWRASSPSRRRSRHRREVGRGVPAQPVGRERRLTGRGSSLAPP